VRALDDLLTGIKMLQGAGSARQGRRLIVNARAVNKVLNIRWLNALDVSNIAHSHFSIGGSVATVGCVDDVCCQGVRDV
jgi:hypothetical protein